MDAAYSNSYRSKDKECVERVFFLKKKIRELALGFFFFPQEEKIKMTMIKKSL